MKRRKSHSDLCYNRCEKDHHRSCSHIMSDCLNHDTVALYRFQKIITDFLEENFKPKKLFYFTDGAAQHFKNKYNLKIYIISDLHAFVEK